MRASTRAKILLGLVFFATLPAGGAGLPVQEPVALEIKAGAKIYIPADWEVMEGVSGPEILSARDSLHNIIFSLYAYPLQDISLEDFVQYMEDYFVGQNWYPVESGEAVKMGDGDGYRFLLAYFLADKKILFAEHIIFEIDDTFYMGRIAAVDSVWDNYAAERYILFTSLVLDEPDK